MSYLGYINDMLDVKVLILLVMARVSSPVTLQKIYELCFQDDKLTYFDVVEAIPQMVETGHLEEVCPGYFSITDSGRNVCDVMESSIAFPVAERAKAAVEEYNQQVRRDSMIATSAIETETGEGLVHMELLDDGKKIMTLELATPTLSQARKLEKIYRKRVSAIYRTVMDAFGEPAERKD